MIKMPEQEKEWNKKRNQSLVEDLDILLADLCVIWGFCNGLTGWELAHDRQLISAENFAQAVLSAEGLNAADANAWFPKIKDAFAERYGESVSESTFDPFKK
jgi:hypothetical protein